MTTNSRPTTSAADAAQSAFRNAFRDHPAGVSVITATVDGDPVGLTASSLASLSLNPLAVSFSLMKSTGTAGKLLKADTLLVHLLTAGQADIAASFAGTGAPKFAPPQGWETSSQGEPLLPSARTVFRIRISDRISSGDATLIAAEVIDIFGSAAPESQVAAEPLIFKGHKFYSLAQTPPLA